MPAFNLCKHIHKFTYTNTLNNELNSNGASNSYIRNEDGVNMLFQDLLSTRWQYEVRKIVKNSETSFLLLTGSYDLRAHDFMSFGSTDIKKRGYSPDAFVQQAIQLASFRLFGKQVATYEATQVRPFRHGR